MPLLFGPKGHADFPGNSPPPAQGRLLQMGQPIVQVGAGRAVLGIKGRQGALQEGHRLLGRGRRRSRPRGQ